VKELYIYIYIYILRLLDSSTRENGAILGVSVCCSVRFWLAGGTGSKASLKSSVSAISLSPVLAEEFDDFFVALVFGIP
jgi:hypothetical protein